MNSFQQPTRPSQLLAFSPSLTTSLLSSQSLARLHLRWMHLALILTVHLQHVAALPNSCLFPSVLVLQRSVPELNHRVTNSLVTNTFSLLLKGVTVVPKQKKPRQNRKPAKVPLQSKKALDQAVYFLYCNESFEESTGKWVQCTKCKKVGRICLCRFW